MTKITYMASDEDPRILDLDDGISVMFGAVQNGIPGIEAACGGMMSCATCHVYVDETWAGAVGPASEDESDMLDVAAAERRPTSRLSCQITVEPQLDGLVVHIPDNQ